MTDDQPWEDINDISLYFLSAPLVNQTIIKEDSLSLKWKKTEKALFFLHLWLQNISRWTYFFLLIKLRKLDPSPMSFGATVRTGKWNLEVTNTQHTGLRMKMLRFSTIEFHIVSVTVDTYRPTPTLLHTSPALSWLHLMGNWNSHFLVHLSKADSQIIQRHNRLFTGWMHRRMHRMHNIYLYFAENQ